LVLFKRGSVPQKAGGSGGLLGAVSAMLPGNGKGA
jgi:hypothetical protein